VVQTFQEPELRKVAKSKLLTVPITINHACHCTKGEERHYGVAVGERESTQRVKASFYIMPPSKAPNFSQQPVETKQSLGMKAISDNFPPALKIGI
jgi:hypothetical protein